MGWRDDDIIDLGYTFGADIEDERFDIDTSELVIDNRSLQKDTSKLKKIHATDWTQYFRALEFYITNIAQKSLQKNIPLVTQKILDDSIRWAEKENRLGYNDYMGGLIHGYKARIVLNGKSINKTWIVSDNISPWGKQKKLKNGKPIFRIMKRRHKVFRHYENAHWHMPNYNSLHKSELPKFRNGIRLKYGDRELNWRGRRLKGKKGGKFRYRVSAGHFSLGSYRYEYYYGRKEKGIARPHGSMFPYYKKQLDRNPMDVEVKRGNFRYVHKIDHRIPSIIQKKELRPNQFRGKIKNGIEIYNVVPYARRVAKLGYNVAPSARVRDIWRSQIATLMEKDFREILKKNFK